MSNEFLKDFFGDESLSFEAFNSKLQEKNLKLADLSKGEYVDKKKYDDDVSTWQKKYNDTQKEYDDILNSLKNEEDDDTKEYNEFMKQFEDLKKTSNETAKELDLYKKKEAMRENGINNKRFMDLAMFELKDSQNFSEDIKKWAEDNKDLIAPKKDDKKNYRTNTKLGGNPDTEEIDDDKFMKSMLKGAGLKPEDLKN